MKEKSKLLNGILGIAWEISYAAALMLAAAAVCIIILLIKL